MTLMERLDELVIKLDQVWTDTPTLTEANGCVVKESVALLRDLRGTLMRIEHELSS